MPKNPLEPELLEGAPLRYAPVNEAGVVFLFSHLCQRMQLHVESVQAGFPDCIARQRVGGQERRIRIEFEFKSSNFRAHRHPVDGCDWIVCWEHDWADVPATLTVVELRRYFGRGFNVWASVGPAVEEWPSRGECAFRKRVAKGDLVLFYEAHPKQSISHIYQVADEPGRERFRDPGRGYSDDGHLVRRVVPIPATCPDVPGRGYAPAGHRVHTLRRVVRLDPPLRIKSLETKRLAEVHRAVFATTHNRKLSAVWWLLHDYLIERYPECADALEPFAPSRV